MKTQTFGIEIKMNHINRERAAVEAGQRRQHFRTAHTRHRVRQPDLPLGRNRNGAGVRSGTPGGLGHTPPHPAASTCMSGWASTHPIPCGTSST